MVGLLEEVSRAVPSRFVSAGDLVVLFGETRDEMGASEYLAEVLGRDEGPCPSLDLAAARAAVDLLVELAAEGWISSAHDLSQGGLAVAAAESCFGTGLGADLDVPSSLSATRLLFSESAPRVLASIPPAAEGAVLAAARRLGVPAAVVGKVTTGRLRISAGGRPVLSEETAVLEALWSGSFREAMESV